MNQTSVNLGVILTNETNFQIWEKKVGRALPPTGVNRPGNATISELVVASLEAIAILTRTCGDNKGIAFSKRFRISVILINAFSLES